ncbi:hypothetical protein [Salarchaeum japonicum]|uniref:Uncharacterized protein n=1 Tax=Salarchaeum japonicum TaxID=555573 RepID=A0AAV3T3C7_9EURY|nr:hypothetical protein [Salarchaeum japonicum]
MPATESQNRITDTGQAGFLLLLSVSCVVFAVGISITLLGLTTPYLISLTDKIAVVAVGIAAILGGATGAYTALS